MKVGCVLCVPLLTACIQPVTEVPGSDSTSNQRWSLQLEPAASPGECDPVVSLRLIAEGTDEQPAPENIALVEGAPSSVSLGKYEEGETTEALAERIVPIESFRETNAIQLRPRGVLALGQTYTVISSVGVLGVVVVAPRNERGYLARLWPPGDSTYGLVQAIYCGKSAPSEGAAVELFPPGHFARLEPGLDVNSDLYENCVRLIPSAPGEDVLLPPVTVEEYAFEPSPFGTSQELAELVPAECEKNESSFGPGCVTIEGDRAVIRGPEGVTFWALSSALGRHFHTLEASSRFVVPNLRQLEGGVLSGIVFDLAGRSRRVQTKIQLQSPSAHLVITEVMSNPLGSEPAEEWVELMNAGEASAVMHDYVLTDGGGQVTLPRMVLEPGAVVLLVREDFVGGTAGDVAPVKGAVAIRLSQLGKNGLSNSGEPLKLLDAAGNVVSAFPARTSERAGVSVARRAPSVLDEELTGFVSHAAPGASPGGPNEVE